MVAAVFVTLVALTLSPTPPGARPAPAPAPAPTATGSYRATPAGGNRATAGAGERASAGAPVGTGVLRADELYSLRARRRLASYLRMRLQELRLEHLDRAADAIERRIPIDELVPVVRPANPDLPSP